MLWGSSGAHTPVQRPFLVALSPSDVLVVTSLLAAPWLLPLSNTWLPWEAHNILQFLNLARAVFISEYLRCYISASYSSSTAAVELCVPSPRTPPQPLPLVSLHFLPSTVPISSRSVSELRLSLYLFLSPACYWRLKWWHKMKCTIPLFIPSYLSWKSPTLFVNHFSSCQHLLWGSFWYPILIFTEPHF